MERYAENELRLSQSVVCVPTQYADKMLSQWLRVTTNGLPPRRCQFNAFGADAAEALDMIKNDSRSCAGRVGSAAQNAWILRKTTATNAVDHERRQRLVADLRQYTKQTDPDRQPERIKLYVIGNLDLNEMSMLIQSLQQEDEPAVRLAAANSVELGARIVVGLPGIHCA